MIKFGGSKGLEYESDLSDLSIPKKKKRHTAVAATFSDTVFNELSATAAEHDITKSTLVKLMVASCLKNGIKS